MVINCDGLKGEKGGLTFQTALEQHSPDLIIGCESKLDTTIPTGSIFPEGYGITRKDGTKSGGGVFTAIRDNLISLDKPHIGSFYRPQKYTSAGYEPINQVFDSFSKTGMIFKQNKNVNVRKSTVTFLISSMKLDSHKFTN